MTDRDIIIEMLKRNEIEFEQIIILKNGEKEDKNATLYVKNSDESDGSVVYFVFNEDLSLKTLQGGDGDSW